MVITTPPRTPASLLYPPIVLINIFITALMKKGFFEVVPLYCNQHGKITQVVSVNSVKVRYLLLERSLELMYSTLVLSIYAKHC